MGTRKSFFERGTQGAGHASWSARVARVLLLSQLDLNRNGTLNSTLNSKQEYGVGSGSLLMQSSRGPF